MKETSIAMRSAAIADNVTRQIASVCFFQQPDARVLAKLEVHLPVAGIDCDHLRGAVLQKTIRKTAGGCAHIKADLAGDIDVPVFECALQFQSAAADIFEIFSEQADHTLCGNLRAGFLDLLIFNQHFARENQRLSPLTRGRQSAVHKKFIESIFKKLLCPTSSTTESASTRSSAKC